MTCRELRASPISTCSRPTTPGAALLCGPRRATGARSRCPPRVADCSRSASPARGRRLHCAATPVNGLSLRPRRAESALRARAAARRAARAGRAALLARRASVGVCASRQMIGPPAAPTLSFAEPPPLPDLVDYAARSPPTSIRSARTPVPPAVPSSTVSGRCVRAVLSASSSCARVSETILAERRAGIVSCSRAYGARQEGASPASSTATRRRRCLRGAAYANATDHLLIQRLI